MDEHTYISTDQNNVLIVGPPLTSYKSASIESLYTREFVNY